MEGEGESLMEKYGVLDCIGAIRNQKREKKRKRNDGYKEKRIRNEMWSDQLDVDGCIRQPGGGGCQIAKANTPSHVMRTQILD